MGDNSPKNQHKLDEQKHDEQVKKDHAKLENAVHQHHPDRASTPEEVLALKKQQEEADATSANTAEEAHGPSKSATPSPLIKP